MVEVLPFGLMTEVRRTDVAVPMKVVLYNGGALPVSLERVTVLRADGTALTTVDLAGERLEGDAGFLGDLLYKMELVDPELSHRHSNRIYLPLEDRPEISPAAEARYFDEILEGVEQLKAAGGLQMRNVTFDLDLARLFGAAIPGDEAAFDVVLDYRDAEGFAAQAWINHSVALLADHLPPPPEWYRTTRGAGDWYVGDLHVHNCRDEAVSGCPDCPAESVNITGSFTNANLKAQFVALGFDWFSTTTHSYCINSDTEFNQVVAESTLLDDPNFVVLCSTELTGKETGGQTGSDGADALCLLGFGSPVHHMGAHAITTRKPGGRDGFLQFCDNPIQGLNSNLPAINQEGGFAIANHPNAALWAFNSTKQFYGITELGALGSEVWNGADPTPNAGNVAWWVNRMLEGDFTYPFSGSDTHDAAFDFAGCFTWVEGTFDDPSLAAAIKSGRNYLSNGPFLDVELRDNAGRRAVGGQIFSVQQSVVPPGYPVRFDVFYNAASSATIRVYRGFVGAASETLLQEFTAVSGSGVLMVTTTVEPAASAWYRAELEYETITGAAVATPVYINLL